MPNTNFLPTEVNPGGLTSLIKNLGRDCHPTQFLREFTKNAIEACQRSGEKICKVVIDYNQKVNQTADVYKICFIDTGDGMTDTQMINLLNNLSASGSVKNEYENYGVGAKISALTRNHEGIQYESWRDGVGHTVFIKYNSDEGIYGIQGIPSDDGLTHYAIKIPDKDKPSEIGTHGTRVTLMGMSWMQDTMLPPEGVSGIKESWIALYLNSRFFRIPDHIEMGARIGYYRENNPKHNYVLKIRGQKAILDEKAQSKGVEQLSDAKLYWWVMPKASDGHGRELLKGHTALLNEDEIFDISDSRSNRVAYFGVVLGRDRVIIYIEPQNVVQNTARTNLVRPDGSPVSWDKWQDEFRSKLPQKLKEFLDDLLNENAKDSHTESIKERLKGLRELYKLSRYKISTKGTMFASPNSDIDFDTGNIRLGVRREVPIPLSPTPKKGGTTGNLSTALLTALVDEDTGIRVSVVEPDPFPKVEWVNVTEEINQQLTDRAAEFIQTENLILANKDYQGVEDLVKYFSKNYSDTPEVIKIIKDEVMQALEQALTECVAGALSLKNRRHWNPKDFEMAISKEALTTAVMQRYWMVSHIKRVLGSKIKGFNEQANG
jgi:hypothetical protein